MHLMVMCLLKARHTHGIPVQVISQFFYAWSSSQESVGVHQLLPFLHAYFKEGLVTDPAGRLVHHNSNKAGYFHVSVISNSTGSY